MYQSFQRGVITMCNFWLLSFSMYCTIWGSNKSGPAFIKKTYFWFLTMKSLRDIFLMVFVSLLEFHCIVCVLLHYLFCISDISWSINFVFHEEKIMCLSFNVGQKICNSESTDSAELHTLLHTGQNLPKLSFWIRSFYPQSHFISTVMTHFCSLLNRSLWENFDGVDVSVRQRKYSCNWGPSALCVCVKPSELCCLLMLRWFSLKTRKVTQGHHTDFLWETRRGKIELTNRTRFLTQQEQQISMWINCARNKDIYQCS